MENINPCISVWYGLRVLYRLYNTFLIELNYSRNILINNALLQCVYYTYNVYYNVGAFVLNRSLKYSLGNLYIFFTLSIRAILHLFTHHRQVCILYYLTCFFLMAFLALYIIVAINT